MYTKATKMRQGGAQRLSFLEASSTVGFLEILHLEGHLPR